MTEGNATDAAVAYLTPEAQARVEIDAMLQAAGWQVQDADKVNLAAGRGVAVREFVMEPPHGRADYLLFVDQKALGVLEAKPAGTILSNVEPPSPIEVDDALRGDPGDRFDMVLTNPPFGRKSSLVFVNEAGEAEREDLTVIREDFWATSSNKQLNFLQHVKTLLKPGGRAAIVVPDNVLFEGGAGESVRRKLLHECDVHTLLRLPTGVFYAQGVKANVLFFDRKPASETPWTKELWIYDLRTNQHFTLKQNPLRREHLDEFVTVYEPEARQEREESERFKRFTYDELLARDKVSLDITWLRDESLEDVDNLPPPEVIAQEIVEDLEAALAEFSAIAESLGAREEQRD